MRGQWSAAPKGGRTCGSCGERIPEGSPIWTHSVTSIIRCQAHAPCSLDREQYNRSRCRQKAADVPVRNLRQEVIPPNPALRDEFHTILRKGGGIKGGPKSRLKPFRDVADDPKVARSGGEW